MGRFTSLERLPAGSREAHLTLTTDNGTQFTSARFIETLGRLGITHRRTAYHHPEGNSYIERFRRSLKEEEVWAAEPEGEGLLNAPSGNALMGISISGTHRIYTCGSRMLTSRADCPPGQANQAPTSTPVTTGQPSNF